MSRCNYGVAISKSGDYQVADTTSGPGIKDDYSLLRSESFTFFVAPSSWVDVKLGISSLVGDNYLTRRRELLSDPSKVRDLILEYHGIRLELAKPSWSQDFDRQDTQWDVYRVDKLK